MNNNRTDKVRHRMRFPWEHITWRNSVHRQCGGSYYWLTAGSRRYACDCREETNWWEESILQCRFVSDKTGNSRQKMHQNSCAFRDCGPWHSWSTRNIESADLWAHEIVVLSMPFSTICDVSSIVWGSSEMMRTFRPLNFRPNFDRSTLKNRSLWSSIPELLHKLINYLRLFQVPDVRKKDRATIPALHPPSKQRS
jgi:hypothetical protein